jgi:uncharacterized protein YjbI with pentapeptide repeats
MGMGEDRQPESTPGRPLTIRAIVLGGVLVGLVGAAAVVALLYFYGGGTDQDRAGLEVVRTAGTLVVGTGGAIALLLTARRQRSTELTLEHQHQTLEHQRATLEHQREVAATAARDALEQRITELYTHAVDQLGNDKAPVRLGGLYSLERLAQNNSDQRQTIVDVICAYLCMPYTPPDDKPPADETPGEARTYYEQRRQELQVRMTAQRILAAHLSLRPHAADNFWADIDLDLREAYLHGIDLTNCHIRNGQFDRAQFSGAVSFDGTQSSGDARFDGTQFSGHVSLQGAQFSGQAWFDGTQFSGDAWFVGAQFGGAVSFVGAQFGGDAYFGVSQVSGDAAFFGMPIVTPAQSNGAKSVGAEFVGTASFKNAQFSSNARFDGARARPGPQHSWPAGWTAREARLNDGEKEGWIYLVSVERSIE